MGGFSSFWAEYPHPPISRKFTREGGAVSIFTYVEIRPPSPSGPGRAGLGPDWGRPPGPGSVPPARGSPPGPGRGVPPGVRGQGRAGAAAGAGVYPPGFCRPGRSGFAAGAGRGLPAGVRRPGPAGRYARLSRRPVFARLLVTKKSQKDKKKISKT